MIPPGSKPSLHTTGRCVVQIPHWEKLVPAIKGVVCRQWSASSGIISAAENYLPKGEPFLGCCHTVTKGYLWPQSLFQCHCLWSPSHRGEVIFHCHLRKTTHHTCVHLHSHLSPPKTKSAPIGQSVFMVRLEDIPSYQILCLQLCGNRCEVFWFPMICLLL